MDIINVPIEKIKVGDNALRMEAQDDSIDTLAASIRRIGVIVPIVVSVDGDNYNVIAGHRRFAAAQRIGLGFIPCILREDEKAVVKEVSFAENLFRKDLSPLEVAAGVKDAIEQKIMDVKSLALAMRKSEHWVAAQLAMLKWPADVLECIHLEKMSVAAASNIALITDDKYRGFLIKNALENGATARITAAWLQAWRSMEPPEVAVTTGPAAGPDRPLPALPQAPCLVCGEVRRTDSMSLVLVCSNCINSIRSAGRGS